MARKYDISFVEAASPVTEPVTRFGGQPVWVEEPQWPLSRQTGEQMRFLCQIALEPELFEVPPGRVAYLFMSGSDTEYVDGTWDPEAGENAVIVQPSSAVPYGGRVELAPSPTGPSLYRLEDAPDGGRREAVPCEYTAGLTPGEDPEYVAEDERLGWDEEEFEAYERLLDGNKVGGTPGFIQSDEFPEGGPWRLLLQLDSAAVPFYINFGDMGVGYAYLSEDGRSGRFLWQCY